MVEELDLNRDGSGHYKITVDGSSMFTDPFLKGMMEGIMEEEGGMALGEGEKLEMDSVIYFKDMPAEQRSKVDRPEFWDGVVMNMKVSESQEKMLLAMEFDFEKVDDIGYFYKTLEEMGGEQGGAMGGGMMGGAGGLFPSGGKLFEVGRKTITRLPMPKLDTKMEGEEAEMMKMFFASGTYKTIYKLPGKVKKSSIEGAEIDGKTVTVSVPLVDFMEGKANMEGLIKYK